MTMTLEQLAGYILGYLTMCVILVLLVMWRLRK